MIDSKIVTLENKQMNKLAIVALKIELCFNSWINRHYFKTSNMKI